MFDVQPADPLYETVRDMPVYACPSDDGGFWMTETGATENCWNLYRFSGNSYDCNYHFSREWAAGERQEVPVRWLQRANAYLRVQLQRFSSTFIIAYEDPFDSAQWNRIPRHGWHKKWNRHNLLFLDSHAADLVTRTDLGTRGPSWKSGSGNAPTDPARGGMTPTTRTISIATSSPWRDTRNSEFRIQNEE